MAEPKISLCVITGNEEMHVLRFLESFKGAFDELCLVRAVGSLPHDHTVALAKKWCADNGKSFECDEHRNSGWIDGLAKNEVRDDNPATWPHVDDFAAARNRSWRMATGDWQLWADLDDLLAPESAQKIRQCAAQSIYDIFLFRYSIPHSQEHNMRERMFRRGISQWEQAVHETCHQFDPAAHKICYEPTVIYSHEPNGEKQRDAERNRRIMAWNLKHIDLFAYHLHQEAFFRFLRTGTKEDAEQATHWAEIAQATNMMPEQRMDMLLNQAEIVGRTDTDHAIDLCWTALRLAPWSRDAWGRIAEFELKAGRYSRAVFMAEAMSVMKKPPESGAPTRDHYFGWRGLDLRLRTLRAAGRHKQADEMAETFFTKHGRKISLLHATRGRPEQALATRQMWLNAALNPLCVQHLFAVDEDDQKSLIALSHYKVIKVENAHGCVRAWNAAAAESTGHVLIQLSDDWTPCLHWDARIWLALEEAAKSKSSTIEDEPLVLGVDDGHRKDRLLCMAILTRARYLAQLDEATGLPVMFSPEYFGVFSDNEFSLRAFRDGVVVDARHIIFDHRHPIFSDIKAGEWDETYQRQNHPDRYAEGEAIFRRRNPDAG